MTTNDESGLRTAIGVMGKVQAVMLVVSAVIVAIVSVALLMLLGNVAEQIQDQEIVVGDFALFCLDHRLLVSIVPASVGFVLAVLALRAKSGARLLFMGLAMIVLVGQVAVLLGAFVTLLAPLYTPQEL